MADTSRIIGAFKIKSDWFKETGRSVAFALTVALLALGIFLGWRHYHHKPTSLQRSAPATVAQIENADQKTVSDFLDNGNVKDYENSQQFLAIRYFDNHDFVNAERVMNELFKNVPSSKISSSSYTLMASIENAKPDKVQYKQYLELSVSKLKAEGNTAQAAVYQKVLDGL